MRFANSEDWMKSMQASNSATSFTPELTSLADLGSMAAADPGTDSGLPSWRRNAGGWAEYWDPFLKDIGKESEKKKTDPVDPVDPIDPVDKKTDGRKFTEMLYGGKSLSDEELTWRMKLNPATTPEDWARAFGKCRTTRSSDKYDSIPSDCYWPEDGGLSGSDFHNNRNSGKIGGRGTGSFNSAAGNRNQKNNKSTKGGTSAPGGQSGGAMRSDIQLKENITFIDKSPAGHS